MVLIIVMVITTKQGCTDSAILVLGLPAKLKFGSHFSAGKPKKIADAEWVESPSSLSSHIKLCAAIATYRKNV